MEVAGDDEEEEDDDEERELAAEDVDHDMEEAVAARERRRNEEKARWGKSEEDIAEEYERRHQREKLQKTFYHDSGGLAAVMGSNVVMAQSSLLPSIHDPKIFKLKCKVGFELQLVRSLMLKTIDVWSKDGIMKIKSAFTTSVKGYIYVESHSEAFAKEIIKGINFIYQSSFQQIAIKEMTSVVSATLTKRPLKPNQWVRIKRGPLKGDLARVLKLVEGGTKAFIQAVPRPDYSPQDGQGRGSAKKAKSNSLRPQQRLFDVEEARAADMYVARRSHPLDKGMRMYNLCNGEYYLNGFLYKEVNVATYIDDRDAKPRLEELQLFQSNAAANQANAEGAQDAADPQSSFMTELAKQIQNIDDDDSKGTSIFTVGDLVKVTGGDMQNLVARVLEVNDASRIAKIIPYDNSFTTTFDIELDLLVKHIMPGAHVKVVAGKYMGQTGRVVNVNEQNGQNIAAILTDGMNMDIQCNVSHLQVNYQLTEHRA